MLTPSQQALVEAAVDPLYDRVTKWRPQGRAPSRGSLLAGRPACRGCQHPVATEGEDCRLCQADPARDQVRRALTRQRRALSRAEQGRCESCGDELSLARIERKQCERCAERYMVNRARRRAARIEAGLCAECGKAPPAPEQRACLGCVARFAAAQKKRRERLIDEGRCVMCAGEIEAARVVRRRLTCRGCAARGTAASRESRRRRVANE